MIISAFILGFFIFLSVALSAYFKSLYHVKPKPALAQITVLGRTEDSEQMTLTTTIFEDDTRDVKAKKLSYLFETREARLKFQNERLLELQKEAEERRKEAEKALKKVGAKVHQIKG